MNRIVALWTHPRSISTAFERVMMERKDFHVMHEPFSYLYYVHEDAATIDQQYIDPGHPSDYPGIKARILKAAEDRPVFFKDMCAHCFDALHPDDAFLSRLTNTFLIRDPAKAIASYYAMNPDVTVEELGLRQLCGIYERAAALGSQPVVVDADDLENDPAGTVKAYCHAVDIPFIPEALTWESEHKPEWDIWKDWHADAAQSTGIRKNVKTFSVTVHNSDHLRSLYGLQRPFYDVLKPMRIRPGVPPAANDTQPE